MHRPSATCWHEPGSPPGSPWRAGAGPPGPSAMAHEVISMTADRRSLGGTEKRTPVTELQNLPNGEPRLISLAPATLTESEIGEMHAVCAANPGYWQSSGDLDPDDISRDAVAAMLHGEAAAEGCELLAARDATGRLVGLAVVLPYNPGDGHPWIGLLLVDGRLHRRGHGRAIAAAIEERFRSEGQPAIRLGILENNIQAQEFWTALGYQEIDRQPDLAKGRRALVMHKDLRSRAPGTAPARRPRNR